MFTKLCPFNYARIYISSARSFSILYRQRNSIQNSLPNCRHSSRKLSDCSSLRSLGWPQALALRYQSQPLHLPRR
jgi:hypothetical protein